MKRRSKAAKVVVGQEKKPPLGSSGGGCGGGGTTGAAVEDEEDDPDDRWWKKKEQQQQTTTLVISSLHRGPPTRRNNNITPTTDSSLVGDDAAAVVCGPCPPRPSCTPNEAYWMVEAGRKKNIADDDDVVIISGPSSSLLCPAPKTIQNLINCMYCASDASPLIVVREAVPVALPPKQHQPARQPGQRSIRYAHCSAGHRRAAIVAQAGIKRTQREEINDTPRTTQESSITKGACPESRNGGLRGNADADTRTHPL